MAHTRTADPPRRCSLPQQTLRASAIPRICQRAPCVLARAHASRASPRPAGRLLGCRWRRSALRPDAGVLSVIWVVCTAHSRSRHVHLLNLPHHPICVTPPPRTQWCSRSTKRAQRERILGGRTRQQSWQQRLFCVPAQTAIRSF